jgi:putative DNA primase/helicase
VDNAAVIAELITKTAHRCGAPFEPEALHVLLALRARDLAGWMDVRAKLKRVNGEVSLTQLDRALRKLERVQKKVVPTHHGYAMDVLKHMASGSYNPVSVRGTLYIPRANSRLWEPLTFGELEKVVAELHDDKENCLRHEDYCSIASHARAIATNDTFFEKAPEGVACLRSFYSARGGKVCKELLSLKHRQTVALDFEPEDLPTPRYDAFMHETFCSKVEGEEEGQRRLMEEFAGAVMLGVAHRYEKAFAWLDRYGRAGKGTLEKIYNKLVPAELCSAASPTLWGKEYYLAMMAGKRLNVVGELAEHLPIPAAEFKSVLGRDEVVGRFPTQPPFTFRNTAGHLFMSNHMIRTNDHSAAFFSRWLLAEFPNSRLKSGLPLDAGLSDRIAKSEMPGIAYKVLQAGARVLQQGGYSPSKVHDRLMAQWQRSASSVDEFIHESCELGASHHCRRSSLYETYRSWCEENGRKPFAKSAFKEKLEFNLQLGIKLATLDGYEIFRGIRMKPDLTAESDLDDPSVSAPVSDQPADF